ncbi:MAG: heavy metal translocating P-type ATPase [Bacteroidetes Order II. Incertae sedis bacterium]|nr:heavy metal translocating P-type ATPase [Bacteroidetes Order II. bacterium]
MSSRSMPIIEQHSTCAHCGLPVPPSLQKAPPAFCCNGCETVFNVLQRSGMDETFYRLRDASASRTLFRPARQKANEPLMEELDTDVFVESHSSVLDGGYHRTHLYLDGVHCAACVWLVERLPGDVEEVRAAHLNLPRARLTLEWDPSTTKLSDIARWLNGFGYPVQPRVDGEEAPESREERHLLIRMGVSWALAGNIMLLAFALYSGLGKSDLGLYTAARWASLLLAIPAILFGGRVFFQKAYHSIRVAWRDRSIRHLHMDTPISIGILVGFVSSAWATITGTGDVWFDSVAVLIAALLSARWLQLRARRLAGNSTEQLLALLPTLARRIEPDGTITRMRADDLKPGDLVEIRAGELIPVDGNITSGLSLINSAVLTGESKPIPGSTGEFVHAGTTNETGRIQVRVVSSGSQTKVGRLLSWVADSKNDRPRILGLADRVGGLFTVSILALALLTAILWAYLDPGNIAPHVIALLVITCPCALGMATPLALAVGTGRAARKGIFIKSESVIDWLNHVDAVVLDKTGTITVGRMAIEHIAGHEESVLLAAAIESESIHPIARAFEQYAEGKTNYAGSEKVHHPGNGVAGRVDQKHVRVGSAAWIGRAPDHLKQDLLDGIQSGNTTVLVEVDQIVEAVVVISDPVRENASMLIQEIQESGKSIILCSGDHEETTARIGARLGIPQRACLGRHSPEMKRDLIEKLSGEGHIVAMVGDGVNDAGALQAAHVGIAVTDGSSASQFAADAYTTRAGLETVAELFRESSGVLRVIHRNLGFSLLYNVGGGILAIAGFVTPLVAAVAMPVSSFIVVLSSIFQRTFRQVDQTP